MPLKQYGVLRGRAIDRQLGAGSSPHYQVHVVDDTTNYRIAINVASKLAPSELEYLIEPRFSHPVLADLAELAPGWHRLAPRPGGAALDFIRTNLFDPRQMVPLPFNVPGPDNDLNEKLDHYIQRAMADEEATLFAFGERWGPEAAKRDKYFGFLPGNGVHDIHMNQGNAEPFVNDDGVYQDGALLLHFPSQNQWVGVFLKFQSQAWHTDDRTGHRIDGGGGGLQPSDGAIRIVAALVNAQQSPEVETVSVVNVTDQAIELAGWRLLDRQKNATALSGRLGPGDALRVQVVPPTVLSNKGGVITLLDPDGLRIDGVSYSRDDVQRPGFSVKF